MNDSQTSACEDDSVLIQPLPAGLAAVYISRSVTRAEENRIRAELGVPARTANRKKTK